MNNPLDDLLQTPEGKTLEFKRDLSSPRNVIRTLVAFANSAGGRLIIGVDDGRRLIGITDPLDDQASQSMQVKESEPTHAPPNPAPSSLRLESRLESRLGSRLAAKVVLLLREHESGKAQLAKALGHKTVSGELHKQIRRLLEMGLIEMTLPDKPASRLQRYRLTADGHAAVA